MSTRSHLTVTKLKNTELNRRAEVLLRNTKEVQEINSLIEADKVWFRDQAKGTTLTETVSGLGSVQVKKGAAASSGITYSFDANKFNTMPEADKKTLIRLGIVTITPYSKAEGTPAVVVTLNK